MNATAIPVDELTGQLLDAADGILADTAAAGLIISHENFLHRDAFRRIISTGASISTGQPLATIGWDAALRALDTGQMPCASSELGFPSYRGHIALREGQRRYARRPAAQWYLPGLSTLL